jgi:hypothetical protein
MSEPSFNMAPVGYVHSGRNDLQDDDWPRGEVRQPRWSSELMQRYWRAGNR